MTPKATEFKVAQLNFNPTVPLPAIPPWILLPVHFTLLENKNKDRDFIFNSHALQACIDSCHSCVQTYTDASKSFVNKIGVAFTVSESHIKVGKRISERLSVYTGEKPAILLAVQWMEDTRPLRAIVCSDSGS